MNVNPALTRTRSAFERQQRPRILIVDDEPMNVILLERLFSREYDVTTATNGRDTLAHLAKSNFDCLLLDIMMPGISGLQVLQSIRADSATAELPVILVSALTERQDVVRGLQRGANDYVTKPIEMDILSARVQTQITLKRLQDQRKLAIEELERAQEMKDQLLRIASHDLKSPLANIGMIRYLLRDAVSDNPIALEYVDMLDSTSEHMLAVIRDFLDTAAIQSGELDLMPEAFPASEVVNEVVEQYRLPALRKDMTFDVEGISGDLYADRMRTAQALDNLVSNAIKYSPMGTTVRITSEQRGDLLRITVIDRGPGISDEDRARLFTQFGRLSARPTGGESSTGLGLWIVKHLINIQGGEVGVDTEIGRGSSFWMELPCVTETHQDTVLERA
jgi:two-component system sensor histidine kinase/response regulator